VRPTDMATLSPDVRNSTLRSLKLTCPSAEGIDRHLPYASTFTPDAPVMERRGINPFGDADGEWSDEEVLIPRNRRKTQYIPPHIKITASAETSSEESSSAEPSPNRAALQGGRIVPPRMPSRREASTMDASQDDLVQRFHRVTKERDALRRELQRKSMGPNGIPATGSIVFKSEEKTLIEELHAMRHEIRIWTEAYFSGPLSARSKRPHMHRAKELFGCITDNYHVYLKHPEERPLLIQAYVWTRLQQKIFNNWHQGAGYVWAGKLGDKSLRSINDTLRKAVKNEVEAEEYHLWRSLTVNLLVPQVDGKWRPTFDAAPVLKRITRFCSRLRRKLRPWSTASLRKGEQQLHTIVSASVALDLKMKRERADYRFVTFTGGRKDQYWGYGFYESEMDDVHEDDDYDDSDEGGYGITGGAKGRRVELALAPALERCGNANGHVFDQSFILVKADVSCKRVEKAQKPARAGTRGRSRGTRAYDGIWNRTT